MTREMKGHRFLQKLWILFVLCAVLLSFDFSFQTASADVALQEGNLLRNPGFEGGYHAWNGIPEVQVAADWTPWWHEDPNHNPAYFRPEYKRAVSAQFPKRVLSGSSAQQWFTFHASHFAGMYQQVFNVSPGGRYRFSIFAQVWSSTEDDPNSSILPANPHLRIGIDPTGNWNPASPDIIWSSEASMSSIIDQWGQISVEADAQNNVLTVFMRTNPDFANKHNDVYWDNSNLSPVSAPPPATAPPTNTPAVTEGLPTTSAPVPTNTATQSASTLTPSPTDTVTPSPSPEPSPSRTPWPTSTPSKEPPTSSPSPSPTQSPTLEPTATASHSARSTEVAEVSVTQVIPPSPTAALVESGSEPDSLTILAIVGVSLALALLAIVVVLMIRRLAAD